jgi:hypothetical protein
MKKHLLILLSLITTFQLGFSQDARLANGKGKNHYAPTVSSQKGITPKSLATIWTDDFSDPNNWDISNQVGNTDDWVIGTGVPSGLYAIPGILSTTATNGFALFDSDLLCSGDQIADLTTVNSINCSGNSAVIISFEQYYRRFDDSTIVFVSTDNINWTGFPLNTTVLNNEYCTGGTANVNPDLVNIDISSVAANQATVWIRFEFYSPSTFVGPGGAPGCGYSWMIDDVSLFEPSAVDAGVTASTLSSGCLLSSTTPVTITINNYGTASISNIPVSFSVNGGAAVNEVAPGPIAPNTSADYTFTATANLSTGASSSVNCTATMPGDANTGNNSFSVTVDNFTPVNLSTAYVMDFEAGDDLSAWAVFDGNGDGVSWAPATTLVYSGTQCIRKAGSGSADDDWMWSGCFNMSAGSTYQLDYWYRQFDLTAPCDLEVFLATSQDVATSTQAIASEVQDTTYRLSSNTFTVPTNGTYYIAWHAFSSTGSSSIRVDLVNLGAATGINEATNAGGVKLFPNPAENVFAIQVKKYDNAMVRIFDVTGNEIYNAALNEMNTTVDVSNYASGLYLVKVEGQNFSYSEKLTVK